MHNFQTHTKEIREEMLKNIGISSIDELFKQIPESARVQELNLPDGVSELDASNKIESIAFKNKTGYLNFMGAGAYNHFIPAAVEAITSRFEFNTAYTPYQAEISQGTLQMIYEFQTLICNLTGLEVATASHYDAATACAEAIFMANRVNKDRTALISDCINPQYLAVIKTYLNAHDVDFEILKSNDLKIDIQNLKNKIQSEIYSCFVMQMPNFYGTLEDVSDIKTIFENSKTILISCVNPMTLGILVQPSAYGAQIAVGDTQVFGCPLSYGGAYCGFMAATDKLKRQLPGRIVGKTVDKDGKDAYCLTLQAREQHIRREKATGNICSNQGLNALAATVYLSLTGKKGLKDVCQLSSKYAHNLAQKLSETGIKILSKNFFNEFVIEVKNVDDFLKKMKDNNILAGVKVGENKILVALTEKNSEFSQNEYIKCVRSLK